MNLSGALYPALRRLELRAMVRAQEPSGHPAQSARHRRVYEPTSNGRATHADWLHAPVDPATASRDLGLHLMRFVMMERIFPRAEVLTFLQSLTDALAGLVAQLEQYMATVEMSDLHPLLALDHGLAVHRASLQWARQTIAALSDAPVPSR
jgi:DNA-binding PadR family transcriptional regulator